MLGTASRFGAIVFGTGLITGPTACSAHVEPATYPAEVSTQRFVEIGDQIERFRRTGPPPEPNQVVSGLTPRLSDPVNITADGVYEMQVRGVPRAEYSDGRPVNFVSPTDARFDVVFGHVSLDCPGDAADCALTFTATVTGFERAYPGLRTWVA